MKAGNYLEQEEAQQDVANFYALLNRLVDEDIKDAIKNNMPLYPNAPRVQNHFIHALSHMK